MRVCHCGVSPGRSPKLSPGGSGSSATPEPARAVSRGGVGGPSGWKAGTLSGGFAGLGTGLTEGFDAIGFFGAVCGGSDVEVADCGVDFVVGCLVGLTGRPAFAGSGDVAGLGGAAGRGGFSGGDGGRAESASVLTRSPSHF